MRSGTAHVLALALALMMAGAPSTTAQEPSQACTTAVLDAVLMRVRECSQCFRNNANNLQACCGERGCSNIFEGLQDIVSSTEACVDGNSDFFDISRLAALGINIGLPDEYCKTGDSDGPDGCRPSSLGRRQLCMAFGDPHIVRFGELPFQSMITCSDVKNDMALLSNNFLTITAKTEPVRRASNATDVPSITGASVITAVTLRYGDSSCGDDVTISGTETFTDTRLQTTVAVDAQTLASGQTVLAVRIITPLVGGRGVCIPSEEESAKCGLVERPPANSRKLLQGTFSDEAIQACKDQGLEGAALSACAFDVTFSGDQTFAKTAGTSSRQHKETTSTLDKEGGDSTTGGDGDSTGDGATGGDSAGDSQGGDAGDGEGGGGGGNSAAMSGPAAGLLLLGAAAVAGALVG